MAHELYTGEIDTLLVPATVIVSQGRIISMRPNAETGVARVWHEPGKPNSFIMSIDDTDEKVQP
jgi:hypothetical protein